MKQCHLIALSLLIILTHSACPSQHQFAQSSCIFRMTYSDSTCNKFAFNNCSWSQCNSGSNNARDEPQCPNWVVTSPSWSTCTSICCGQALTGQQNADTIQECQEYILNKGKLSTGAIVGIVTGSIAGCCLLGILCTWLGQKARKKYEEHQGKNQNEFQIKYVNELNSSSNQDQLSEKFDKKAMKNTEQSWTKEQKQNQNLQRHCCLCQETDPSVELECGHVYHCSCFKEYLKEQKKCHECDHTSFENIKVFCKKCITWSYLGNPPNQLQKLLEDNLTCNLCTRSEEGDDKITYDSG